MSGKQANLEDFAEEFANIAKKVNFANYKIVKRNTTNKGDGYIGLITFVDLINSANNKEVLSLVIKSAPKDETSRSAVQARSAFLVEQLMYTRVLQTFSSIQQEFNITNPFKSFPKCYATSDEELNEFIILENLKTSGFKLKNRSEPMNKEHLTHILKEYGKYHSLSFALKAKNPNLFEEFIPNLQQGMSEFFERVEHGVYKTMTEQIVEYFLTKKCNKKLAEEYKQYSKDTIQILIKEFNKKDKYCVISHGDCWGNNFMFKYQDDEEKCLSEVKILDWQVSSFISPVIDIGYFFWACSHPKLYEFHEDFLKIYHDSLTDHLHHFGLNSDDVLSFAELQNQWNKGIRFASFMTLLVFKIMLVDGEEAPDFAEDETGELTAFSNEITRMDEYFKKHELLIEFWHKNNLLK